MKNFIGLWIAISIQLSCSSLYGSNKNDNADHSLSDRQHFLYFGLLRSRYMNSDIQIRQPRYGRNIRYHDVQAQDDSRIDHFQGYHITELQFYLRHVYMLDAYWSVESSIYHLTYIVNPLQPVRASGYWQHERVDEVRWMADDLSQFEHSNGINVINFQGARRFFLEKYDALGLKIRFGAGLAIVNSNNEIYSPEGNIEKYESSKDLSLGGFQISTGISLEWRVFDNLSIEYLVEPSYMNLTEIEVTHGKAEQQIAYVTRSFQLGYGF